MNLKRCSRAQAAYDARDWASALELLQAAYALSPRAAFLFNIGQAQRKLGHCAAARDSYAAYSAGLSDERTHDDARSRVLAATRELDNCEEAAAQAPIEPTAPIAPITRTQPSAAAEASAGRGAASCRCAASERGAQTAAPRPGAAR